jgi:hypothetical protein
LYLIVPVIGGALRFVMTSLREQGAAMLRSIGAAGQPAAMPCHPHYRLQPSSAKSRLAKAGLADQVAAPTEKKAERAKRQS